MDYSCALCSVTLPDPKDRYSASGRSAFKILEATSRLPFTVNVTESSHLCRKCVARLKKKTNLEEAYNKCLNEIHELVSKQCASTSAEETCGGNFIQPISTSTPYKANSKSNSKPKNEYVPSPSVERTQVHVSKMYDCSLHFA